MGGKIELPKNIIEKKVSERDSCLFLYKSLWDFGILEPVGASCLKHKGEGSIIPALIYSQRLR